MIPADYVITVVRQDSTATADIDYPDTLPGVCTITVTAENQVYTQTYRLSLNSENGTGSEEIKNEEDRFFFYPNPCENFLVIESAAFGYARIYDMSSRLVKELLIDDYVTRHNVSELQTGYYHISYQLPKKTVSKKLLIL